ncbi:hypothetical protein QP028_02155 [Corynebacterium suedekumii]|nr:hypothetical protein QP028_02155 [Corynebacterium suedekumii]
MTASPCTIGSGLSLARVCPPAHELTQKTELRGTDDPEHPQEDQQHRDADGEPAQR